MSAAKFIFPANACSMLLLRSKLIALTCLLFYKSVRSERFVKYLFATNVFEANIFLKIMLA
jgi:hypothetical protein